MLTKILALNANIQAWFGSIILQIALFNKQVNCFRCSFKIELYKILKL